MRFSELWRWDGRVGRAAYATVGLVGVAIKHNLDRLIASSFLGYKNSFNYWAPLGKAARLDHLPDTEAKFLATLLLVSLPFIWGGVAMTVKRLRDAGQPVWLVVLFFVPFINLLFFFFFARCRRMSVLKNWKERRGRDRLESIASSRTTESAARRLRL